MKRVCAWCNKPYGDLDEEASESDLVTHGMCPECAGVFANPWPGSLREHLNTYVEPILCVDSDCRVLTANDSACEALGHDTSTIGDLLFGEVALCPWALRDAGCGSHEHCLGCTVRRTVSETFATGRGVTRHPTYIERTLSDGRIQQIQLLVTSERQGSVVLIRIDDLDEDYEAPDAPPTHATPSPRNPR
jgi:hypothetical protein